MTKNLPKDLVSIQVDQTNKNNQKVILLLSYIDITIYVYIYIYIYIYI